SRSPRESTQSGAPPQSATSPDRDTGASLPTGPPNRPAVSNTSPAEGAPSARSVTTTAPAATHTAAARRSHPRHGRPRAGPARSTVRGHPHARSPVTGAAALAPASGHSRGLMLLLASLASAVLMFASLTLLRLVKRFGGTLSAGSRP